MSRIYLLIYFSYMYRDFLYTIGYILFDFLYTCWFFIFQHLNVTIISMQGEGQVGSAYLAFVPFHCHSIIYSKKQLV